MCEYDAKFLKYGDINFAHLKCLFTPHNFFFWTWTHERDWSSPKPQKGTALLWRFCWRSVRWYDVCASLGIKKEERNSQWRHFPIEFSQLLIQQLTVIPSFQGFGAVNRNLWVDQGKIYGLLLPVKLHLNRCRPCEENNRTIAYDTGNKQRDIQSNEQTNH